jgi:hypothetical protein
MRALLLTASFLSLTAASAAASAAESPTAPTGTAEEPQTLFNRPRPSESGISGWFIAPTFGGTVYSGEAAYTTGLRAGVYVNRQFAIGLVANTFATENTSFSDDGVRNMGNYGGFLFQYVLHSNRLVHGTFESTVGYGRWCDVIDDAHDGCSGKTFLAVEPMANVELNVARHVRLSAGLGYRLAIAEGGPGPSSRDLSNVVVRTGVVFGSF